MTLLVLDEAFPEITVDLVRIFRLSPKWNLIFTHILGSSPRRVHSSPSGCPFAPVRNPHYTHVHVMPGPTLPIYRHRLRRTYHQPLNPITPTNIRKYL